MKRPFGATAGLRSTPGPASNVSSRAFFASLRIRRSSTEAPAASPVTITPLPSGSMVGLVRSNERISTLVHQRFGRAAAVGRQPPETGPAVEPGHEDDALAVAAPRRRRKRRDAVG